MDSFTSEPFDDAGGTGAGSDRADPRDSLLLRAELTVGGRRETVRIRNLSTGGLMAEYPHPLDPAAAVTLVIKGLGEITGTVAWSAAGRIGIAFDQPVDPLRARKPVARKTVTAPPRTALFSRY